MAKKASAQGNKERGGKSQAIRDYLTANGNAMPKDVTAALKLQGVDVSPNLVSIVKAKMGIRRAKRKARHAVANKEATAAAQTSNAAALDSALTLYKAARGQEIPGARVREAFLRLVETLG